jgi:hypothetical protein
MNEKSSQNFRRIKASSRNTMLGSSNLSKRTEIELKEFHKPVIDIESSRSRRGINSSR